MADTQHVITEFQSSPYKVNLGIGAPDEGQLKKAMGHFKTATEKMMVRVHLVLSGVVVIWVAYLAGKAT